MSRAGRARRDCGMPGAAMALQGPLHGPLQQAALPGWAVSSAAQSGGAAAVLVSLVPGLACATLLCDTCLGRP